MQTCHHFTIALDVDQPLDYDLNVVIERLKNEDVKCNEYIRCIAATGVKVTQLLNILNIDSALLDNELNITPGLGVLVKHRIRMRRSDLEESDVGVNAFGSEVASKQKRSKDRADYIRLMCLRGFWLDSLSRSKTSSSAASVIFSNVVHAVNQNESSANDDDKLSSQVALRRLF